MKRILKEIISDSHVRMRSRNILKPLTHDDDEEEDVRY